MTEDIGLKLRRGILVIARNRNAYFHFICPYPTIIPTEANKDAENPIALSNTRRTNVPSRADAIILLISMPKPKVKASSSTELPNA